MIKKPIKSMKFEVKSDLNEIENATAVLRKFLSNIRLSDSDNYDVRLCFEETLINAMKYGNRLNPDITVKVYVAYNASELFLAVEDEGDGFDPAAIKDPTKDENIESSGGRGVYLVHRLMNEVTYSAKGNRVELIKKYEVVK